MGKFKKNLLLGVCFGCCVYADVGVEVDVGPSYPERECYVEPDGEVYCEEEPEVIWIGPGWYYGIWFDNEVEFEDWHHHHHGHDHDHHHDHGHPHDYPHSWEHGGHHGGGGGHGGGHK